MELLSLNHPLSSILLGISGGVCLGWVIRGCYMRCPAGKSALLKLPTAETEYSSLSGKCKLVLIVRSDLKMGTGKIGAQCSHAAVLAYEQAAKHAPGILKDWRKNGQLKVVLKIVDEASMLELAKVARQANLITSLVADAGRTQVEAGTKTVLGVGPGPINLIDSVTGHLKLL